MVAVGVLGGAIGVSLLALGGFRLHGFLQGIRMYREKTKSETVLVPSKQFLQIIDPSRQSQEDYKFFRINDEVMGGKSVSALSFTNGEGLLFSGNINTNGGGFASCRTL